MKFENIEAVYAAIKAVRQVPKWVIDARENHKELKAIVYGDEYKTLLLKIEHIEEGGKALARQKYARPIKDIISKILAPIDNVFSATGGSKVFNIQNETTKKEFISHVSNIREGKSIEQWLQAYFAKDLYEVDPSGLMFFEWKDGKTWLTYKSIDCIRSYVASGLNPEYVIFEPKTEKTATGENITMVRVVDDAMDYCIIQTGEILTVDETRTFQNPFKRVPGRIISDRKRLGKENRLSAIDEIVETAKEFLRDRSILTIHKFLHGFSTPYRPVIICPECHGTKKNGIEKCAACNGTGKIMDNDITYEILLPIDLTSETQPTLPSNFAGFISPDLEIWDQYRKELKELFKEMFESMWGTRESEEVKDQTAMGVILNTQPMITQLNKVSDIVESHESAFISLLAAFYMKTEDKIAVITYGRNYIIQPPEFLLTEYQNSNVKGDPITIRDRKLTEFLTSKYKNDPETLRIELLKKELEPYIHFDIKLVKEIYGVNEAMKKGWFTDFWESLQESDKNLPVLSLQLKMDEYFKSRKQLIESDQAPTVLTGKDPDIQTPDLLLT